MMCNKKLRNRNCSRQERLICKTFNKNVESKFFFEIELLDIIDIIKNNIVMGLEFLTSFSEAKYDHQKANNVKYPDISCYH